MIVILGLARFWTRAVDIYSFSKGKNKYEHIMREEDINEVL